ncbi:hypothetical protein [Bradyrhizobium sp.]|uniref:hypothetical protein n=1 Tax=Bradyrhizobium sp. TaxID=376 RepID=UPI003C652854
MLAMVRPVLSFLWSERQIRALNVFHLASWRLSADTGAKRERSKVIAWLSFATPETARCTFAPTSKATAILAGASVAKRDTIAMTFMQPGRIVAGKWSASTVNQ